MTTYKNIADAHARIAVLEQANAELHLEADTWWEALAMAVRKNDSLQAELAKTSAQADRFADRLFAQQQANPGTAADRKPR